METWLSIAGYEGRYELSDLGRIRSLNYMHTGRTVVLKPVDYKGGLKAFCDSRSLDRRAMLRVAKGQGHQHKGWRLAFQIAT